MNVPISLPCKHTLPPDSVCVRLRVCVCSCVEVARVPPTMCCALNDICVCHHADYSAARDSYVYTQMHTHTHTHTVRGWCVFTR